jgi:hypothetical protein
MKNGREQQYNNNTPRNYMIEMPDVRIGSHVWPPKLCADIDAAAPSSY